MAYGIIGYSQPNTITQASGSIFGDFQSQQLLDESSGYFTFKTFDNEVTLPGLPSSAANAGTFTQDANFDHALLITTGATAQNGAIIYTRPTAPITPGSGIKVAFEASISVSSIASVKGIFVGLVNLTGMTNALIQAASATAASNLITAVAGTSLVGFWSHGDALTNFDAVYVNSVVGTAGLQPATGSAAASGKVKTVIANVLTLPTQTAYPNAANPLGYAATASTPVVPAGALVANAAQTTTGWVKLGLRYDGQQYLYFYVNGTQVAKIVVSAATLDVLSTYGGVVAITTGTAAASTVDVNFFRKADLLFA
jgi:hypothetical protein